MSLSFERFGGAWHHSWNSDWYSQRSATHLQVTAEPRTTTTYGTALTLQAR